MTQILLHLKWNYQVYIANFSPKHITSHSLDLMSPTSADGTHNNEDNLYIALNFNNPWVTGTRHSSKHTDQDTL